MGALARFRDAVELVRLGAPPVVGPTGELAYVTSARWRRDAFMILSARIDEAGTDGRSPCITMGGFVGSIPGWNAFDHSWRKQLRRANLSYFHASEFWGSKNETRGVPFEEKQVAARRFWRTHDKRGRLLFGFSMRVDNDDYQYYRQAVPSKLPKDSQYGLCFRVVLATIVQNAIKYAKTDDVRVNFLLEDGHKNAGDAVRIFAEAKKHGGELAPKLGVLAFGEKKKYPGLQAADGIVTTSQRIEARNAETYEDIDPSASIDGLRSELIKTPIFRAHCQRTVIDDMVQAMVRRKELQHEVWLAQRAAKISSGANPSDEESDQ
jgi:Protein of unknown function (DUF3800)